ncbi:MAG: hypothetical protein P8Y24_11095 [Gammaproteobacteria bacterium]
MPIQANNNAPNTLTFTCDHFLKSSTQESLPSDKTQTCRLHELTFRMPLFTPVKAENNTKIGPQPQQTDGNLTLNFTPAAHRKAYLGRPVNHPNVHLPFPASSEDKRDG